MLRNLVFAVLLFGAGGLASAKAQPTLASLQPPTAQYVPSGNTSAGPVLPGSELPAMASPSMAAPNNGAYFQPSSAVTPYSGGPSSFVPPYGASPYQRARGRRSVCDFAAGGRRSPKPAARLFLRFRCKRIARSRAGRSGPTP